MSFIDHRPSRNRPAILAAVAVLHAAAIYALVTGLGVAYYDKIIGNLPTREYPADPPPPEKKPKELPKPDDPVRVAQKPVMETPIDDSRLLVPIEANLPGPIIPDFPFVNPDPPKPPSSFTPASPRPRGKPGLWATSNDYPAHDIRQGNEGTARFLLTIGVDGAVQDCTIIRSSGYPGLDHATCENVSQRARFEPATDSHGYRVTGTYSGSIKWVIPK